LKVDYLAPSHPRHKEINVWYLAATNYVVGCGGATGYDVADVVPVNVAVDETGARVCKVCSGPLVKKPGRGRWPHTCEACRAGNNNGGGLTRQVEPIKVQPGGLITLGGKPEHWSADNPCTLCGCEKGKTCECGKTCTHPTHKVI